MFKRLILSVAVISSVSVPTSILATPSDDIAALQNMSYMTGNWKEGEIQIKQRRCAPDGSYQDGKYRSFITYAAGFPSVTYNAASDDFYVYHSYSCRTRTRIVTGCGGEQINTDDTTYYGVARLTLTVTRLGKVKVDTTKHDFGGHELCGVGLINELTHRIQDKTI